MTLSHKRTLNSLEFLSPEGFRFELKRDGWWIIKPRTLGEREREKARELLDKMEVCLPPVLNETDPPPTMMEIGEHVAKTFGLRINHHRFKQK